MAKQQETGDGSLCSSISSTLTLSKEEVNP
jgi:hypothetical protein